MNNLRIQFKSAPGDGVPRYEILLYCHGDDELLGTIEQADDWELPRRPRWTLRLNPERKALYFDSLADAKEHVCGVARRAIVAALQTIQHGHGH